MATFISLVWAASLVGILISPWLVLYQVIKQQGRLLIRLDGVEARLQRIEPRTLAKPQPKGLLPGTPLPSFRLPDLNGKSIGLEDFHGERVFLVNWNPGCGFCTRIAPELTNLQTALKNQKVAMVLFAHGGSEANQNCVEKHGLRCPILLSNSESKVFQNLGTPAAYVLDELGRVASPVAIGADQVPALARQIFEKRSPQTQTGNQVNRQKILGAGKRAPDFLLHDVVNRVISAAEYLKRRVILVLSDPYCGGCEQVAARLARVQHRCKAQGIEVLLVSRGSPEENLRKAQKYGFSFPVALQNDRELAAAFGTTAVPAAFLIGPDGTIERDVALGDLEIGNLLDQVLKPGARFNHSQDARPVGIAVPTKLSMGGQE